MCKKGPPAVWTKEKIEEAFAGFVEKNRRLPVAREMKPQYGLPTRRTFERYMDMTAQEYAELRYPTLLSARDERHVQTVLEYRNEVREWSIERLMEAEKNFFTKCGRLPEPYEYTAENGLPTVNLDGYTSSGEELLKAATSLYDRIVDKTLLARRLTLCANHLLDESSVPEDLPEQIDLFTDYSAKEKQKKEADTAHARERKLQETMLDIKKRFGKNAILKGLNLEDGATARERNNQIGGHKA